MGLRGMATPAPLHQVSAGAQRLVEALCSTGVRPEKEDRDDRRQRVLMVSAASERRRVSLRTPRARTGYDSGSEAHSFPRVSIACSASESGGCYSRHAPPGPGAGLTGCPAWLLEKSLDGSGVQGAAPGIPAQGCPASRGTRLLRHQWAEWTAGSCPGSRIGDGAHRPSPAGSWKCPGPRAGTPGPACMRPSGPQRSAGGYAAASIGGVVGGWRRQSRSSTSRAHGRQGRLNRDRVSCCEAAAIRSMA